jgi:hypothetical protein
MFPSIATATEGNLMSFIARDLSVLAYANGFTLWHYRTEDSLADLLEYRDGRPSAGNDNGYFSPAHELLRAGDQITINLISRDAISLIHLVVARITGTGAVAVTAMLWPQDTVVDAMPHPDLPERQIYAA